jgi:hypothetical protein
MYTPEWAEAQFLVTVQGDGQRAVLCQGWAACTREVIECHWHDPTLEQAQQVLARLSCWDEWQTCGGEPYLWSVSYEDGSVEVTRVTQARPAPPAHVLLRGLRMEQVDGGAVARPAVSHEEARRAVQRLINSHFGNPRPAVVRLPAQPDDDDLLAVAYIAQQEDRERWLHACVMPAPPGDWDLKDAAKARAYNHIRQQLYREAQT